MYINENIVVILTQTQIVEYIYRKNIQSLLSEYSITGNYYSTRYELLCELGNVSLTRYDSCSA